MVNRKNYDEEYKAQAVKLANEKGGRKAAEELGISSKILYGWMSKANSGIALTISFRFSQGWRAYGYCSTNEYANCDHEYLFVAILNVTCAFSAFLG